MAANATLQFLPTVVNAADQSGVWSTVGDGTITQGGLFTAPASAGVTFIRFTSNADPTKFVQAMVTTTVDSNPNPSGDQPEESRPLRPQVTDDLVANTRPARQDPSWVRRTP